MSKMWPRCALEKLWNLDENQDESFKNILDGDISSTSKFYLLWTQMWGWFLLNRKIKSNLWYTIFQIILWKYSILFFKCVLHGQFNFLSANNSIMLHKQEKLDLQCTTSKTFEIINVLNNLISMNFYWIFRH